MVFDGKKEIPDINFDSYLEILQEQVFDGFESPAAVFVKLKQLVDKIENVISSIKKDAIAEIKDEFLEVGNAKLTIFAAGRYEYKHNPTWVSTQNTIKNIEKNMQDSYKMLKDGKTLIDETTGEIITPAEYKPNEKSIKITYKKSI